MKKKFSEIVKILAAILTFILLISLVYHFSGGKQNSQEKYQEENLSAFLIKVKAKSIYQAEFIGGEKVKYTTYSGKSFTTFVPPGLKDIIITNLHNNGTNIKYTPVATEIRRSKWFDMIIDILLFLGFMLMIRSQSGSMGNIIKSNNANPVIKSKIRFSDVVGINEYKIEVEEIVNFLKNPQIYLSKGVKIPKGILLAGPPGTGKTLLAKAVAGEAGVAFFSATGSDFVEMYVGVGASRMRALFENARKNAPAVIFIDEIDAIGQKRNHLTSTEHSGTLASLLSLMDGFQESQIIVMGATNLLDVLDAALLRAGRFDRIIQVPLPDVNGRYEIIKLVLSRIPIPHSLDILEVARMTLNFSGAALTNLINEALFMVVRKKVNVLTHREVEEALSKVLFGIGRSKEYDMYDKILTAYHEAGHAIVAHELRQFKQYKIFKLTIINHTDALGFLAYLPKDDKVHTTQENLLANIKTALGGRAAEEIFFGATKSTTGATSDLEKATQLSYLMASRFGMTGSKFSMDEKHSALFSEAFKEDSYNLCNQILNDSYREVLEIIIKNKNIIHCIVYFLMKYETLYKIDLENIINGDYHLVGEAGSIQIKLPHLSPFDKSIMNF